MKGVIFTEFIEMLEIQQSPAFADEVLDSSDLPSGGAYTAVGTYDSAELSMLVRATAERLQLTEREVLRGYGRFVFGRLAVLYPELVAGYAGACAFLERLSWLHYSEVVKLYPDGHFPQFESRILGPDVMTVVYRSHRHLGDFAEGLLQGVLDHFGESMSISRRELADDGTAVMFTLTRTRA